MQKSYLYLLPLTLMTFFLVVGFLSNDSLQAQCGDRYLEEIFDDVVVTSNVQYGANLNASGQIQELHIDVYEPSGDEYTERATIIFAHGGSFVGGDKELDDMVYLCNAFAKRGFVTVSMQYRLTSLFSLAVPENMIKAVLQGTQDGKGVVRYLRQDADTDNLFRIDPEQIYMGGVSAGSVIATHVAYMGPEDEIDIPAEWMDYVDDVGGFEGISGPQGYSSNISGVINFSGALGIDDMLDEGDVPIISFHSIDDGTVPFGIDPPFGSGFLPDLYGSQPIHNRAVEVGVTSSLFPFEGDLHPHFVDGTNLLTDELNTAIDDICQFYQPFLSCPDSTDMPVDTTDNPVDTTIAGLQQLPAASFTIAPNPAHSQVLIRANNATEEFNWQLFNQNGILMREGQSNSGSFVMQREDWTNGLYFVRIQTSNGVIHKKLLFH